jgi:hypothetical protein
VGYQNRKNICGFLQVVKTSSFVDLATATMVIPVDQRQYIPSLWEILSKEFEWVANMQINI